MTAEKKPVVEQVGPYRVGEVVTSEKFVAKSGISTFDNKEAKVKPQNEKRS